MPSDPNERNRRWYARNRDSQRRRSKTYRQKNLSARAAYQRSYTATPSGKEALVRSRLKKKYGITIEEWDRLLAKQGGRCAICRTDDPGKRGFFVDHDHKAKKIRGLLCHLCNAGIGYLKDDPRVLRIAASYIERHAQTGFFDAKTE